MWSRLKALPPYLGGKRRLLGHIFKHLPKPTEAPVFVDAFLGGGSVSLMAKAKGYRVICNDIALRSYVVGKALIENNKLKLEESDLLRLFVPVQNRSDFITNNFTPDVLPKKHAEFLDNAMAVLNQNGTPKRWLLLLMIIKYILRLRPMGNFGAKTIMHQIEKADWELMNPNYVKDIINRKIYGHPKKILERLLKQINQGVFDNGRDNEAYQLDVFEFLSEIGSGDILYLDPPYAGTSSYERALYPLDCMISGEMLHSKPSVFSQNNAFEFLERLFAASQHIRIWVISYGNARIDLNQLTELIKKFKREVVVEEFKYVHLTGLSGDEHREKNREYLIYAKG
jgi:adenine-specific DNA methylase